MYRIHTYGDRQYDQPDLRTKEIIQFYDDYRLYGNYAAVSACVRLYWFDGWNCD